MTGQPAIFEGDVKGIPVLSFCGQSKGLAGQKVATRGQSKDRAGRERARPFTGHKKPTLATISRNLKTHVLKAKHNVTRLLFNFGLACLIDISSEPAQRKHMTGPYHPRKDMTIPVSYTHLTL